MKNTVDYGRWRFSFQDSPFAIHAPRMNDPEEDAAPQSIYQVRIMIQDYVIGSRYSFTVSVHGIGLRYQVTVYQITISHPVIAVTTLQRHDWSCVGDFNDRTGVDYGIGLRYQITVPGKYFGLQCLISISNRVSITVPVYDIWLRYQFTVWDWCINYWTGLQYPMRCRTHEWPSKMRS